MWTTLFYEASQQSKGGCYPHILSLAQMSVCFAKDPYRRMPFGNRVWQLWGNILPVSTLEPVMSYRLTGFMRFIEIWNVWFQDLYWSFMWWLHSCRFPLRRRMKALSSESMESGRWGVGLMQKMDPTWSNIQCILRFGCTVLTKATVMVTT